MAMQKNIQAVFFDLDGSTVMPDLLFPDSFVSVVNRYRDRKWIITTGRGMWSVVDLRLHEGFDGKTPHIFDNGALICQINGEFFRKHLLNEKEKNDALVFLPTQQCVNFIYASVFPKTGFVWPATEKSSAAYGSLVVYERYEDFVNALMNFEVTKISVKCPLDIQFPSSLNVVRNQNSSDILSRRSSKGNAVDIVRRLLGLKAEEIAFIGDDHNDVSAITSEALSGMSIIKVGSKLPEFSADICVESVQEVAPHIEALLTR
jgi:hydroxymethylpyrimidine pyrophosphatase-like HAD family hydrolase